MELNAMTKSECEEKVEQLQAKLKDMKIPLEFEKIFKEPERLEEIEALQIRIKQGDLIGSSVMLQGIQTPVPQDFRPLMKNIFEPKRAYGKSKVNIRETTMHLAEWTVLLGLVGKVLQLHLTDRVVKTQAIEAEIAAITGHLDMLTSEESAEKETQKSAALDDRVEDLERTILAQQRELVQQDRRLSNQQETINDQIDSISTQEGKIASQQGEIVNLQHNTTKRDPKLDSATPPPCTIETVEPPIVADDPLADPPEDEAEIDLDTTG